MHWVCTCLLDKGLTLCQAYQTEVSVPLLAWELLQQRASIALHTIAFKVLGWIFADRKSPAGVGTHTYALAQGSDECRVSFLQQGLQVNNCLSSILHGSRSGQASVASDVDTLLVDRFHFGESIGELAAQQQQPGFRPTCMRYKLWHPVNHKHPQPHYHLFTGTQVSHQWLHSCLSSLMCLCMTSHSGIL